MRVFIMSAMAAVMLTAGGASAATLVEIAPASTFTDTLALTGFARSTRTAYHGYGRGYGGATYYDSDEALTVRGSLTVTASALDFNLMDFADQPISPFFRALITVAGETFAWDVGHDQHENAERATLRLSDDGPLGLVSYLFETSANGSGNAPGEVWEGDGWALNVSEVSAVPLPATAPLLGLAMVGLWFTRRRATARV